jgi:Arc/MetJ-type ribon-helix-helix transcriptional regulator
MGSIMAKRVIAGDGRVQVAIPNEDAKEIEELVKEGVFSNKQEVVKFAVRRYLDEKEGN